MPYYTGKGDDGHSGLLGRERPMKSDVIFHAIGDVDELNSAIGTAVYYTHHDIVRSELKRIQNELFVIGANLASLQMEKIPEAKLDDEAVASLEKSIESLDKQMPELKKFVIPGGCEASIHLHVARAIARRAERNLVAAAEKYMVEPNVKKYLNRLSSYLFVTAIYLNHTAGVKESHPTY